MDTKVICVKCMSPKKMSVGLGKMIGDSWNEEKTSYDDQIAKLHEELEAEVASHENKLAKSCVRN